MFKGYMVPGVPVFYAPVRYHPESQRCEQRTVEAPSRRFQRNKLQHGSLSFKSPGPTPCRFLKPFGEVHSHRMSSQCDAIC